MKNFLLVLHLHCSFCINNSIEKKLTANDIIKRQNEPTLKYGSPVIPYLRKNDSFINKSKKQIADYLKIILENKYIQNYIFTEGDLLPLL